jgi:hypothetical protein
VRGNNYLLDGVPIADLGNRAVIIPSFEAIQELKMQVNNYDAEAGRTGGGIFNVTARSGSNQVRGSLFGFLRPNPLQANNFFNNRNGIRRPDADYYLYGGAIGGPVYIPKVYHGRDRTFFWFSFEGYRMQSFLSETFTVPTDLERQGNFSQTKNGGAPVVIYDPLTTRPNPNSPGRRTDRAMPRAVITMRRPRRSTTAPISRRSNSIILSANGTKSAEAICGTGAANRSPTIIKTPPIRAGACYSAASMRSRSTTSSR